MMLNEMKVLSCIFIDSDCIKDIYGMLEPKNFSDSTCRVIYAKCLEMYSSGDKVDAVIVLDKIRRENELMYSQAKEKIATVLRSGVTSAGVKTFAMSVLDDYMTNSFKHIVNKKDETNIRDKIGNTINELSVLYKNKNNSTSTMKQVYERNSHKFFNPDYKPSKLHLGFRKTDEIIGGIENGDICVIGARPSVGKSAFVSQIIMSMGMYGKKIMFYSLEMSEEQVYERFIAYKSGIPISQIKNQKEFTSGIEEKRFESANEDIIKMNILVNTDGGKSVSDIKRECKYIDGLDCIVIDYLQLIKAEGTYKGNRTAEVGEISKSLKELAMELKIPIIILSQLNRALTTRAEKEPTMADLRESGDIEQDASVVILLWNADEGDDRLKGLKVDKNRHGETGRQLLEFNAPVMTFHESRKEFPKNYEQNHKKSFRNGEREATPFD